GNEASARAFACELDFKASSLSFVQDHDLAAQAVDSDALSGSQVAAHAGHPGYGGQPKLSRHDGAVRKHAAGFHDHSAGVDKQRHPGRVTRRTDQNARTARLLASVRLM